MHNYEHEIPHMDDRTMRKSVRSDYFHDSVISETAF